MNFFTIYNKDTGEINNSGVCSDVSIQVVPEGFLMIELQSDPLTQYVKNNLIKSIPPKPNFECSFDFTNEVWVPSFDEQSRAIRAQRKMLLLQSDWTDTLSAKNRLGQELYDQWQTYRQALRDITDQPGYPFNIVWPTPPQ